MEAPLYFWRDQHGHEVDLVIDQGDYLFCMVIKNGQTFNADFLASVRWLNKLQGRQHAACVYGGDESFRIDDLSVLSWKELPALRA